MIHTVKGFSIVSKGEIDIFLKLSCFFDDPVDIGNLISSSSAFWNPASTSGSSWFMYCWSLTWRLKHYFASMWDECNCAVVWAFFGISLLWNWNENWPFPVLWSLLSFPNFLEFSCSFYDPTDLRTDRLLVTVNPISCNMESVLYFLFLTLSFITLSWKFIAYRRNTYNLS